MAGADRQARKTSDLAVRTLSALVMVLIAGGALWLGGLAWLGFVVVVALGTLYEWTRLFLAFTASFAGRLAWGLAGALYVGVAGLALVLLRREGWDQALFPVLLVVATDVGAYFTGRTLGGPKIAPAISPSKTWSGLAGGMIAAGAVATLPAALFAQAGQGLSLTLVAFGMAAAVFAQAGDFFESWMKRRAGVKDSGALIPGHGGLFDRLDGLIAVLFVYAVAALAFFTYEAATLGRIPH
jgi:phosphatidate cytidylyltransferase